MNISSRLCRVWGLTVVAVAILGALLVSGALFFDSWLVVEKPLEKADAIVVMAGSPSARLPFAVKLFKMGKAPTILLTNDGILGAWSPAHQRNLYQVEWAKIDLIEQGVPQEVIEILKYSRSGTYYDVLNTRGHVFENEMKSLVVVTSDYHTRRTLWCFNRLLDGYPFDVGIYPADCASLEGRSLSESFARLKILTLEVVKVVYYKVRFGFIQ